MVCAHDERLCVCRVCHRRLVPTNRWVGVIRFHAHFKLYRCTLSTRRSCVLKKQQVSLTTRITGRSMSALSTTSDVASTGLPLPPGAVGDCYDNALAENVNGSYNNELIHTRRWDGGVEVEIAAFEWVSWWNETRLHQSLGYRAPVEVETEWWKQNPPQEIIEIKANA